MPTLSVSSEPNQNGMLEADTIPLAMPMALAGGILLVSAQQFGGMQTCFTTDAAGLFTATISVFGAPAGLQFTAQAEMLAGSQATEISDAYTVTLAL